MATLISGLKDLYCLFKHKAIYAEKFYGLERNGPRTKTVIMLEMFLWVIFPYICRKLEQKFLVLKDE